MYVVYFYSSLTLVSICFDLAALVRLFSYREIQADELLSQLIVAGLHYLVDDGYSRYQALLIH